MLRQVAGEAAGGPPTPTWGEASPVPARPGRRGSYYVTVRDGYSCVARVISVKLPVRLLQGVDRLIEEGYFQNRSDAFREAVRRLLVTYRDAERVKPVVGVR